MADSVVKGKNIDASKLTFSAPKVLDNGAKLVYMNYDGGRFTVQTPRWGCLGQCRLTQMINIQNTASHFHSEEWMKVQK